MQRRRPRRRDGGRAFWRAWFVAMLEAIVLSSVGSLCAVKIICMKWLLVGRSSIYLNPHRVALVSGDCLSAVVEVLRFSRTLRVLGGMVVTVPALGRGEYLSCLSRLAVGPLLGFA